MKTIYRVLNVINIIEAFNFKFAEQKKKIIDQLIKPNSQQWLR